MNNRGGISTPSLVGKPMKKSDTNFGDWKKRLTIQEAVVLTTLTCSHCPLRYEKFVNHNCNDDHCYERVKGWFERRTENNNRGKSK